MTVEPAPTINNYQLIIITLVGCVTGITYRVNRTNPYRGPETRFL
ncbi:conserved protein of unknown function [Limnospira indica PCC 8005]|uniref:Uncharacterized protein n=1 Tax=Limnospira indica PCC 8005 TaxID=376219 RepID=A0A9P1KCU7_9CYAN|nr:conserved protein of unknown function [Limnospira indica PCC 8005]